MTSVALGQPISLVADYTAAPVNPRVSIFDPASVEVVTDAVPRHVVDSVYAYTFDTAGHTVSAGWVARWTGTVEGFPVTDDEAFDIVEAVAAGSGTAVGTTAEAWPLAVPCDMTADPVKAAAAKEVATEAVWARTGRRYRTAPAVLRPCRRRDVLRDGWGIEPAGWGPQRITSGWVNVCGHWGDDCSCAPADTILLPSPCTVTQVRVDGQVLTEGEYRVYDGGRRLVRTGGVRWPECNDLGLADTEPGTWSVTVTQGSPPSALALAAASELACEVFKAMTGDKTCRLSFAATQIARQGVTIVLDPKDLMVGLPLCSLLIATENPDGIHEQSKVYSPDTPRARRQ